MTNPMNPNPAERAESDQLDAAARDLFDRNGLEPVDRPRMIDHAWLESHNAWDLMAMLIRHARQTTAGGHIDALVAFPDAQDPAATARFQWYVLRRKEEDQ